MKTAADREASSMIECWRSKNKSNTLRIVQVDSVFDHQSRIQNLLRSPRPHSHLGLRTLVKTMRRWWPLQPDVLWEKWGVTDWASGNSSCYQVLSSGTDRTENLDSSSDRQDWLLVLREQGYCDSSGSGTLLSTGGSYGTGSVTGSAWEREQSGTHEEVHSNVKPSTEIHIFIFK